MIDERELQELATFESKGTPVLSLYLDTDLTQQPKEQCKLVLRDLLERVRGSASDRDVTRIETFFGQEYDWRSRGVAIFSLAEQKLWRVYTLVLPVKSDVCASTRLYLKPLSHLLDEYMRYGVALIDREGARFFLVHQRQIEEKNEWIGEELKHHKQGGSAATRYQRRVDQQAEQNLKLVAEAVARFCQDNQCNRLVLAGSDETVAQFKEMLPKAQRKQVAGTLVMDMEADVAEVRDRSMELIRDQERQRTGKLVEDLITATAKGAGAVTGLADVLYAAHEGRVHILVIEEDFEAEGYLCGDCGYISAQLIAKCPFCGGQPERIEDAVNYVIHDVIKVSGKVETVVESEALAKAGHIGAILRY